MAKLEPVPIAKWLLIGFALAVLAIQFWRADAIDVVFLSIAFLPWIIGAAALPAFCVRKAQSGWAAWCFLAVEIAAICSTAYLWAALFLHPDAQNGIAAMLFPIAQFVIALPICAAIALLSEWQDRRLKPNP